MILNIVAKLLALCLCSIAVNGLDGISNEDVNRDRISRLSNHIDNLKNLLDPSPRYNNYDRRQSLLPNIYNKENDYNIYLRRYYIEPILDSLKEILEQVYIKTGGSNSPRPFYGQIPEQFASSYGSGHGIVGGRGASSTLSQSQGIVGQTLSFPLNENTDNNGSETPQPLGVNDSSPITQSNQNHEFGTGHALNFGSAQSNVELSGHRLYSHTYANGLQELNDGSSSYSPANNRPGIDLGSNLSPSYGLSPIIKENTQAHKLSTTYLSGPSTQSHRFDSDLSSKAPPNTHTNKFNFGFGSSLPSYDQSHKFGFENAQQFNDLGNRDWLSLIKTPVSKFGSQSSYANTRPFIANRYPDDDDDDKNRNWGLVEEKDDADDKVPITLKLKTSTQSNCDSESHNNKNAKSAPIQHLRRLPSAALTCKAAVLSCCTPGTNEHDRRDCFASQGCVRSYDTGLACLPVVIRAVYKEFYENL